MVASRHKNSQVYTLTWNSGQRISQLLNPVGYLNYLTLTVDLAVVVSVVDAGTDVPDTSTLNNWFPFVGIRSPQGGYQTTTSYKSLFDFQYRYGPAPGVNPTTDPARVGINKASATTQNIHEQIIIPCGLNDNLNFSTGMLMRQISANQYTLELQCANLTDIMGPGTVNQAGHFTITGITGTITIGEVFYDAINSAKVQPPNFRIISRLRESGYGPLVIGDNLVRYDRGPVICDAIHRVFNNNAPLGPSTGEAAGTGVNWIQIKANVGVEYERRTGTDLIHDQTLKTGNTWRTGVYHINNFDDRDGVNVTSGRDFINSRLATQFIYDVNASPASISNLNGVTSLYRELVQLGV